MKKCHIIYHQKMKSSLFAGVVLHTLQGLIFYELFNPFLFRWALLYMALYPGVQKKVRAEIEELLGRNRLPSMQDKGNLPYTEAVIQEISRLGSIAPLSLPHRCTATFTLNGYTIPQNAMVFSNLYAVHHDPNNFPDPFVFKPERFLSNDGQKVTKADFLIPFGIGKTSTRSCLETYSEKKSIIFFLHTQAIS